MLASTKTSTAELVQSFGVLVLVKMLNVYVVKQLEILTLQQLKKAWPLILKMLYALSLI